MRKETWPIDLAALIASRMDAPFRWGVNDCCLFAADVVNELTGVDPAADLRGAYFSPIAAARILKERGGVREIASSSLTEINPKLAQRGDVVMVQTAEHGDTLAVCIGAECVAPGIDRLQRLPMSNAVAAWRVI